jgi:serine phosphatase RsbU (regulator of sigma subunit)
LPFEARLNQQLGIGKYFVMYRPRDIVSGDFYWFNIVDETRILIVADCTGHGVQGAFMSMIGMNLLEEVVNTQKNTSPDVISDKMNRAVRYALGQDKYKDVHESMDMMVLTHRIGENCAYFSGAMLPLYYVQNDEIHEVRAAKKTIGGIEQYADESYYCEKIDITSRTIFYLATDGYKDQFGGINKKKFLAKNLKNLFHSVANLPLNEQKKIAEKTFDDWIAASGEKQTDDVTIFAWEILPV